MISKKAKAYEESQYEGHLEISFMLKHRKCPHCVGDVKMVDPDEGHFSMECQDCGLKRS